VKHKIDPDFPLDRIRTINPENPSIWYLKTSADAKGEGIQLLYNVRDGVVRYDTQYVLQPEIRCKNVLDGRKSDWRVYVCLRYRANEAYGYFYEIGLHRPCLHQYDPKSLDLSRHLTNRHVQEQMPDFSFDHYTKAAEERFDEVILNQIRRIVRRSFERCLPCWRSWGERGLLFMAYDLLIDPDRKVWLLETNGSPGISEYGEKIAATQQRMFHDMVNQILLPAVGVLDESNGSDGGWICCYQTQEIESTGTNSWVKTIKPPLEQEPKVTIGDILDGKAETIMNQWRFCGGCGSSEKGVDS